MRNLKFGLLAVPGILLSACVAQAAVTSVKAVTVPQGVVPNSTTNDVLIDFTGNLRGQQMILDLTAGSIFQQAVFGSNTAPNGALFAAFPDVEFDTYVTVGGRRSDGPKPPASQDILVVGGAVDLQPGSSLLFDTSDLNIAWAPAPGVNIGEGTDYITSRITLTNDAQGIFRYFGSTTAGSGPDLIREGTVVNGVISFGSLNTPPMVADKAVDYFSVHPSTIVSETLDLTDDDPAGGVWSIDSFASPNGQPASIDPATGLFSWLGNGTPEGTYDAVLKFTDAGGLSGTGTLAITWHVPEPTSFALLGLALVGLAGFRRK